MALRGSSHPQTCCVIAGSDNMQMRLGCSLMEPACSCLAADWPARSGMCVFTFWPFSMAYVTSTGGLTVIHDLLETLKTSKYTGCPTKEKTDKVLV